VFNVITKVYFTLARNASNHDVKDACVSVTDTD